MSNHKFKFLVVQGRTLQQTEDSMQHFPSSWQDEFPLISKLGFYGIEWIFDKKSETNNPILTEEGRKNMKKLSQLYNIHLENIVFDWFITHPILFDDQFTVGKKVQRLIQLIELSEKAGFKRIILPLLEQNNINSTERQSQFIRIFKNVIEEYLKTKIEIHLETSLPPQKEVKILEKLGHDKVKLCFDMGNSASYGHQPSHALKIIQQFIGSVHIKDRKLNGSSVPLGKGDVKFYEVFRTLVDIDFCGPFTFQVYRNKDSDNIAIMKDSLMFINRVLAEVLIKQA